MPQVNMSTKRAKKFKSTFLLLKTIHFTVINVITYQLKSRKLSFTSPLEVIETCHFPMFKNSKPCYINKNKSFKMFKHIRKFYFIVINGDCYEF